MFKRAKSKKLEPLGGILAKTLQELGLSEHLREYHAVQAWDRVVGEPTCRHARAWAIDKGVLTVFVDAHTWLQELAFLRPDIVRKLNAELGSEVVKEIVFRLSRSRPE